MTRRRAEKPAAEREHTYRRELTWQELQHGDIITIDGEGTRQYRFLDVAVCRDTDVVLWVNVIGPINRPRQPKAFRAVTADRIRVPSARVLARQRARRAAEE